MDSASLLPSCLRFLAGVRFMVDMILAAGVVMLLLLCASVWFFVVLLVVEECLAFGVRMLSGQILHGSQ
jgi:hypothetical protein